MADIVDEPLISGANDVIVVADSSVLAEPSGVGSGDAERLCDAVEGEVVNVLNESARLDAFYAANPDAEKLPDDVSAILEKLSGTERYVLTIEGIEYLFSVTRELNSGAKTDKDFYYNVVVVPPMGSGGVYGGYVAQNGKWISRKVWGGTAERVSDLLRKIDEAVELEEYSIAPGHFRTNPDYEELPEDLLSMIDRLPHGDRRQLKIGEYWCLVSVRRESLPLSKPGSSRPCIEVTISPQMISLGGENVSFALLDGCLSKKNKMDSLGRIREVMEKVVASLDAGNRFEHCG